MAGRGRIGALIRQAIAVQITRHTRLGEVGLPKDRVASLALAIVALGAGVAQADPWIDRYPPPNNLALVGLSSNGDAGVGEKSTLGNLLLNAATGTFTPIGGNASSAGFFGSLSISGNGAWVADNATAPNGYSQAARYDVATGTWTTLGSLNVYNTYSSETFKHVLLPIWIASFRYQDKPYQFLVNGQTGEVVGKAPWSFWKIFFLVLFLLAVVALVMVFGNHR